LLTIRSELSASSTVIHNYNSSADVKQIIKRPGGRYLTAVGRVPALEDEVELFRTVQFAVALEPAGFHHSAAHRRRRLLVLSGEGVLALRLAQLFEDLHRFSFGMEHFAFAVAVGDGLPQARDFEALVFLGDRLFLRGSSRGRAGPLLDTRLV
jgi:hypothetical protein